MPSFHVLALLGLLSLCDFSEAVSIPMGLSLAKQPDVQFDSGLFDELLEVISEDEPLFVDNDIAEDDNVFSDSGLFEELLRKRRTRSQVERETIKSLHQTVYLQIRSPQPSWMTLRKS